ncbi:hypothetical protein MMC19_005506 [Ptychographa xylographoides]|nr:hypothetical protein [Ptychographa xylographoides]
MSKVLYRLVVGIRTIAITLSEGGPTSKRLTGVIDTKIKEEMVKRVEEELPGLPEDVGEVCFTYLHYQFLVIVSNLASDISSSFHRAADDRDPNVHGSALVFRTNGEYWKSIHVARKKKE